MSEAKKTNQNQQRVIDLNVNGHLMSLDAGLYCIYHAPNQAAADEFGFPGLRICLPPFKQSAHVSVETFEQDGWLGAEKSAALVRVSGGPGLILVTVYQNPANQIPAPKLQVVRLNDAPDQPNNLPVSTEMKQQQDQSLQAQQEAVKQASSAQEDDITIFAHVQRMGDVSVKLGDWIGIPDSKTWIEGFGLGVNKYIDPEDIEYQAVLGKGWMSPWYKGNQFCGSRGMALPLCGLRVKLGGEAAKKYRTRLTATFIDGTKLGPVEDDTTLTAESVAPLEALCFELISIADGKSVAKEVVEVEESTPIVNKKTENKTVRSNIKLKKSSTKAAPAKSAERKTVAKASPKKK